MKIIQLMHVPPLGRNVAWLGESLQAAITLELATIPPYLCALWSIKDQAGPVYGLIRNIVVQEMLHMGLACNMLTAVNGTPLICDASATQKYPGPLPGGVRPNLIVKLTGLTLHAVEKVFMEIEHPEGAPVALAFGQTYPTIGAFYDAILDVFRTLDVSDISGQRQLLLDGIGLFGIGTLADAERAINKIKVQGEGASQSPFGDELGGDLAHYYKFAEIYHGHELIEIAKGKWEYTGPVLSFPDTFPMAEVPAGGYPESRSFDQQYTAMLKELQSAWADGDQNRLDRAITRMYSLSELARELMRKPLPTGNGNLGPDFHVLM